MSADEIKVKSTVGVLSRQKRPKLRHSAILWQDQHELKNLLENFPIPGLPVVSIADFGIVWRKTVPSIERCLVASLL